MDAKKFLLGTLGGGVAYFLLGFIFYGMLLMDFFANNSGSATGLAKEPMAMWAIALGNFAHAALLTYIFGQWANISTFATGAKAGAIIGFLIALGGNFLAYGTSNISNLNAVIVDSLVYAVLSAIAGGLIGLILGKVK